MNTNYEEQEHYSVAYQDTKRQLWKLMREKRLLGLDLLIAEYLANHMDIKTGRIEVRATQMAEEMGVADGRVFQGMKRLRDEMLLTRGQKPTGYYWMLNPHYWSSGRQTLQGKRIAAFNNLVND